MIDASEHLGMLHHVVRSAILDIPDNLKDEALSEGLVLLQMACMSYDPSYRVPPHYWIAQKLRWGLKNWKHREFSKHGQNNTFMGDDEEQEPYYSPEEAIQAALELGHLVETCQEVMSHEEYFAFMSWAVGFQMKEVTKYLHANPAQVRSMQHEAKKRVLEMKIL